MTINEPITIGVLALQGAFIEHINHFNSLITSYPSYDLSFPEIKTSEELLKCDALVIPGGESTSISLISERTNLLEPLKSFVKSGKPIWGTCAGLIFLSKQLLNGKPRQQILGAIDIQVQRNAFGRQLDSFESPLDFSSFIASKTHFPAIFIRAPVITKILDHTNTTIPAIPLPIDAKLLKDNTSITINTSNDYTNTSTVEILHQLDSGLIVAVRQGNKLATAFHPELSNDSSFHKYFIDEFVVNK